jgi:hypothetical protein
MSINRRLERLSFAPSLLSRITLATAFIVSGRRKLADLEGTAKYFEQLGIPVPEAMAKFVSATEVASGALIGLGLGTRMARDRSRRILSLLTCVSGRFQKVVLSRSRRSRRSRQRNETYLQYDVATCFASSIVSESGLLRTQTS